MGVYGPIVSAQTDAPSSVGVPPRLPLSDVCFSEKVRRAALLCDVMACLRARLSVSAPPLVIEAAGEDSVLNGALREPRRLPPLKLL